jgi:hypothetical protein
MFFLIAMPSVREKTLRRLANIQDRDEREEYITGKAARASYIAGLSLMLLFLFFSLINFNVNNLQQPNPTKPAHSFGIGFHYSFFSKPEIKKSSPSEIHTVFESSDYSLSNTTLVLILLGWQLLVFNLAARKERIRD